MFVCSSRLGAIFKLFESVRARSGSLGLAQVRSGPTTFDATEGASTLKKDRQIERKAVRLNGNVKEPPAGNNPEERQTDR